MLYYIQADQDTRIHSQKLESNNTQEVRDPTQQIDKHGSNKPHASVGFTKNEAGVDIDWGSLDIYTCVNSCGINNQQYCSNIPSNTANTSPANTSPTTTDTDRNDMHNNTVLVLKEETVVLQIPPSIHH